MEGITWAWWVGLVVAACVTSALTAAGGRGGEDYEYRLVRDLMRNYDFRVRPSRNATEALNVTFGLALAQIIDVDEKNQIITTNCWLNQAWMDVNLQWDPAEYGGLKVIRIPHDSIWKPDILLYNNADVSSYKSSISTNAIVSSDGNVTWLSMMIFRSSCAIDVQYFPFDEQNCSMLFSSWTYDGFQLNLIKVGEDGDTSNYIPNSEWTLVKLHAERNVVYYSCCAEPYPDVTYIIQMRRKPLFYVFNMILPCLLITLVALLGFYIPSDSGEKVTMGITTLLSMTVFLMLVAENMPPTSDALPLMGLYYGITIAIVSFATAMTVLTLNIHHKGLRGNEVPNYIKKICFGFFGRLLCLKLEMPAEYLTTNTYACDGAEAAGAGTGSSYIKLKAKRSSMDNGKTTRLGSLGDSFSTSRTYGDYSGRSASERFEMSDKRPENGGLSPRFSSRLRALPPSGTPADNFERQFLKVLHKVYQTIEKNEMRLAEQDRRDTIRLEWQQVAMVVDRVLLIIFMSITIGVTVGIMLQSPLSRRILFGQDTPGIGSGSDKNPDTTT